MFRLKTAATALGLVLAICLSAAAAQKTDLSGKWVMDKAKSEGLPPDMEQTMNITQKGDELTIATTVKTSQGEQTLTDTYKLNGKPVEFTPSRPTPDGGTITGKGTKTGTWAAEGKELELVQEEHLEVPSGEEITIKITRKWHIAADGKSITIDLTAETPNGPQSTKRLFVKQ